jgi:hypothetical protein
MAKYRIKVEALDPAEELRAEYRVGIECDRFYFAAITDADKDGDKGQLVALENVNKLDIAGSIFENDTLMEAALIADGLRRGEEYHKSRMQINRAIKVSGEDMKNLFRKMMGEDE